ncbi:MAG TPA: hypothetical protein VGM81_15430 [Burkholderiaceae bacterium]|jgi:hypothetical protein
MMKGGHLEEAGQNLIMKGSTSPALLPACSANEGLQALQNKSRDQ